MNIGQKTGSEPSSGTSYILYNGLPDWERIRKMPWYQALFDCPQNPEYHAEGNVGIHTEMVMDALTSLPEYIALRDYDKEIVLQAALFHDVGKPKCTIEVEGKMKSPRHAKVGEKMTREFLWDMSYWEREEVCALVRLHGLPLWSLEKANPRAAVISSSLRVSNRLIYILAKADVLGRICQDKDELLERLEYFKEFCLENQCFETPYPFKNNHSRFRYFFTGAEYPAELFDDTQFSIEIMSGIAGSGKDTILKSRDVPIISLDDLRREMRVNHADKKGQGQVVQKAYEQAKKYAAAKQSFIWNSTNITTDQRAKLIGKLAVYNPKFKITYVETAIASIFKRRVADIPKKSLEKMIANLEIPLLSEAHEVSHNRN